MTLRFTLIKVTLKHVPTFVVSWIEERRDARMQKWKMERGV